MGRDSCYNLLIEFLKKWLHFFCEVSNFVQDVSVMVQKGKICYITIM